MQVGSQSIKRMDMLLLLLITEITFLQPLVDVSKVEQIVDSQEQTTFAYSYTQQIQKWTSKISEIYRRWHQNCFINTRLSITLRQDCACSTHSNSERMVGTEEISYGFYFKCGKARHQTKSCPCFNCRQHAVLTVDKQNMEEVDW